jgi:hypothetical protein
MPLRKDTRSDRRFEALPSNWIFLLCEAFELALLAKVYQKYRQEVRPTLESLQRVKDARGEGSGSSTSKPPPDRPWRYVEELDRIERSLFLLVENPKFRSRWPLAEELLASIAAEKEGRERGEIEHELLD